MECFRSKGVLEAIRIDRNIHPSPRVFQRGDMARKMYARKMYAAIIIQCRWRCHQAYSRCRVARELIKNRKMAELEKHQAYTVKLRAELNQLRGKNAHLEQALAVSYRSVQAELEKNRKQQALLQWQGKIAEEAKQRYAAAYAFSEVKIAGLTKELEDEKKKTDELQLQVQRLENQVMLHNRYQQWRQVKRIENGERKKMEKYEVIEEVGSGSFGTVLKAKHVVSGELVAIKTLHKKVDTWGECLALTEVQALQQLNHPNIVKLKELIWEDNALSFVFEYMDNTLWGKIMEAILKHKRYISEDAIKRVCYQVLQGLSYMHQHQYIHRDLKLDNLLVSNSFIKIADLGMTGPMDFIPPYVQCIGTPGYRAPEVLLNSYIYDTQVDMWAMGIIMVELYKLTPLFPVSSTDCAHELNTICSVIGSPGNSWTDGLVLARNVNYRFPKFNGVDLSMLIPSASSDTINLMGSLLSWDPSKRPTAAEALEHRFFRSMPP